jgi:hypothetical protein
MCMDVYNGAVSETLVFSRAKVASQAWAGETPQRAGTQIRDIP